MEDHGSVAVRLGNLEADGDAVRDFCRRSLVGFSDERYDKYFRANPSGTPTFVVARSEDGAVVGVAALHPSRMLVDGEPRPVVVAGDFAVAESLRGFGPALPLQRRLVEEIEPAFVLAFGLPNPPARAVLKRVGYRDIGRFRRLERKLARREQLLGALRGSRMRSGPEIESLRAFDPRFDEVWAAAAARARVAPARSVDDLNWRFDLGSPGSRFSITASFVDGRVTAYSVWHVDYGMRRIVDLGWLDAESLRDVVRSDLAAAGRSRLAGVDLLHLGSGRELDDALAPLGFVAVEAPFVMAYPTDRMPDGLLDADAWELFEGAIDV